MLKGHNLIKKDKNEGKEEEKQKGGLVKFEEQYFGENITGDDMEKKERRITRLDAG